MVRASTHPTSQANRNRVRVANLKLGALLAFEPKPPSTRLSQIRAGGTGSLRRPLIERRASLPVQRESNLLGETSVPIWLKTMFSEAIANFAGNSQRVCFIGFGINA